MKLHVDKGVVHVLLVLPLLALSISGCATNKGNSANTSEPPQIPPKSTFVMDFADFISNGSTSLNPRSEEGVTQLVSFLPQNQNLFGLTNALGDRSNWGFAALNVGFWNVVGVLGLAVPVAAFIESFNHTPVQNSDYTWVWTYSVTVQGVVYTAELNGKYINSGVRWEMYITKQNDYSHFPWYYGESNLPATQGYWVLKNKPADPTDLLRIDWHRNLTQNTSDITYTNIIPSGPENGGYIEYKVTTDQPYNRSYTIYNKGKSETTDIQWSSITKEGRVRDPIHFSSDKWYYWDSQLKNTEMP